MHLKIKLSVEYKFGLEKTPFSIQFSMKTTRIDVFNNIFVRLSEIQDEFCIEIKEIFNKIIFNLLQQIEVNHESRNCRITKRRKINLI